MRTARLFCLLIAALGATLAAAQAHAPADLILRNAVIATMNAAQPQAEALAIRDGRIEAVGSNAAMAAYSGPHTRVTDMHGAFITPGFIESHGHLLDTGTNLTELNLGAAPNWDAIVALVRAAAAKAKPGEWIVGAGFQQSKWKPVPQPNLDGLPLPASLDAASPHNPVMLEHASGHALFVNAAALKLAGITRQTPDPPGGTIVRDAAGDAIGMLRDTAMGAVDRAYNRSLSAQSASQRASERRHTLDLAVQNEIQKGITTFDDMGESFQTADWVKQQAAQGLPLRLYININGESPAALAAHLAQAKVIGAYDDHFTIRGIGEITSDGALGTRSAWFLQPYSDAPGITGKNVTPMDEIRQMAEVAARDGFQVSVHAIGDRANHETLDVFQQVFASQPAARDLRWRIEHAQHLLPSDIPRIGQMHVIASMQSIHACSDAPYVTPRLGATRAQQGAYVWQSLYHTGAMIVDGTDTPVEDTNPIANFYCGVTRDEGNGTTFYPAQAKTRQEELRSYTRDAAYAIFEDHELGTISPGMRADLDVISGNLLTLPAHDILRTRVLYTIVGGKTVYQRPGAGAWHSGQLFPPMPEFDHVN